LHNHTLNRAIPTDSSHVFRTLIENSIEDGIDFLHMDALSLAVAMKVDRDLQLTLMASSLNRLLAARLGNGYETARSRHLFLDFVCALAGVTITEVDIAVRFQECARNPLLVAEGSTRPTLRSGGWEASVSDSSSGSLGLGPGAGVV
jgi:hypothetical protein